MLRAPVPVCVLRETSEGLREGETDDRGSRTMRNRPYPSARAQCCGVATAISSPPQKERKTLLARSSDSQHQKQHAPRRQSAAATSGPPRLLFGTILGTKERMKENRQPKGGMGGRYAATTQGF